MENFNSEIKKKKFEWNNGILRGAIGLQRRKM